MRLWFIINLALLITLFCNSKTNPNVRQSALAGRWYSSQPSKLTSTIDNLLNKAGTKKKINPVLLIQPHAGYIYSGGVAAAGYNLVKSLSPDVIIIIAPTHYSSFHGCSILPVDFYETPLGRVKVDKASVKKLLKESLFKTDNYAHREEHSIEIHLPFLQRIYGKRLENTIPVVPIIVGDISRDDAKKIASVIIRSMGNRKSPLFIISSDFTHYGARFNYLPFKSSDKSVIKRMIRNLDFGAIDMILKKDLSGFCGYLKKTGATICGRNPIKIALALSMKDFKAELITYDTSANITGDFNNSVSYASISFSGKIQSGAHNEAGSVPNTNFKLSGKDKKFLLNLARTNIESLLRKNKNVEIKSDSVPQNCRYETGVFVTLKKKGHLRGCIGYVIGRKPLFEAVINNSYNAAFKDPRFPSLKNNELADIKIEISVLTVPEKIKSVDEISVGRDGLIIEQDYHKGLLLPQVPVEWGWNKEEFLIHTCRKAGLSDYAWKHGAKIYRFEAIVFGEDSI